jgi:prepilin-type N-terminal cleavage/methylation domain-containing protein
LAKSNSSNSASGFSLIEVLVATTLLATALVTLAQLFALSTKANMSSRNSTYAAVLAEQKIEELRSLSWGFDTLGLPFSDMTTNTTVTPATQDGTGLTASPGPTLNENTSGYVDYIDMFGNKLGTGQNPPESAIYTRRWSIEPLPINPNNTLIIQVLVTRNRARGAADDGAVLRLPDEARVITVKTRKAQ